MSAEDTIATRVYDYWSEFVADDKLDIQFDPEVHYNHYGDRGVVDCVISVESQPDESEVEEYSELRGWGESFARQMLTETNIHVYEIKSWSATENTTGANEIIRQFNRHCDFFYKGSDFKKEHHAAFWLIFEGCLEAQDHVKQNWPLYRSILSRDGVKGGYIKLDSRYPLPILVDGELRDWTDELGPVG